MKSPTPKVLHRIGGRTLLDRAIDTAEALSCERIVVVCGAHSPQVGEHAGSAWATARPWRSRIRPQGTGHAVRAAEAALAGFDGDVVITYADVPAAGAPRRLAPLFEACAAKGSRPGRAGLRGGHDPAAYGRLILAPARGLLRIVEAKDADDTRQAGQALQFRRPGRRPRPAVRPAGQCQQRQRQPGILPDRRGRPGP